MLSTPANEKHERRPTSEEKERMPAKKGGARKTFDVFPKEVLEVLCEGCRSQVKQFFRGSMDVYKYQEQLLRDMMEKFEEDIAFQKNEIIAMYESKIEGIISDFSLRKESMLFENEQKKDVDLI